MADRRPRPRQLAPFPRERLASDTIGQAYAQRTGALVSAHWILPDDADRMLAQAAAVTFEV